MTKFTCLITSGRSGSTLLMTILNTLANVYAEESYFMTTGNRKNCYTRMYDKSEDVKNDFIKNKIEYIKNLKCDHYIDTVSLSCQDNIIERFIDNGYMMNVITLRRNPMDAAKSYYELDWNPINTPMSFLNPSKGGLKMTLKDPHQYQNCLWYCFEIERIAREYKDKLKKLGVKHYETNLREILSIDSFNDIMRYFEMPLLEKPFVERINELKELKLLSLDDDLAKELQYAFIQDIRLNNEFDDTFFDMNKWLI